MRFNNQRSGGFGSCEFARDRVGELGLRLCHTLFTILQGPRNEMSLLVAATLQLLIRRPDVVDVNLHSPTLTLKVRFAFSSIIIDWFIFWRAREKCWFSFFLLFLIIFFFFLSLTISFLSNFSLTCV